MAPSIMSPTSIHEDSGSILALLSGLRMQCCHELWCRSQTQLRFGVAWLDLARSWIWLGCRTAAAAPIQPLAWEPPYATGAALKKENPKQTKKIVAFLYVHSKID